MELDARQRRVLGVLVEKEATTPEQYPLTSKALTTGCNQKHNRDPLTDHSEREVDAVLLDLRAMGLARTVHAAGARVPKHRHVLDEAWGLDRRQLAVLAVLFLRGPNTLNELLTRTERYVGFASADEVRAVLRSLEDRDPPLVAELAPRAGQREARFTHLAGDDAEAPAPGSATTPTASTDPVTPSAPPPVPADPAAAPPARDLAAEVDALRREVTELNARFEELLLRLGEDGSGEGG